MDVGLFPRVNAGSRIKEIWLNGKVYGYLGMKFVLIIVFALLLLGGGGAGAYFYFKQPAMAAVDATGEIAHAPKAAKEKKKGHGAESKFVELDALILPVVTKSGV